MWEKVISYVLQEHRGKVVGICAGLLASIFIINYGFFKTIFIIFCICLGYFIGKKLDEEKSFDSWLKQMFKEK